MPLSYHSFLCAFLGTWIHTQYNFPKWVILYLCTKIFPPSTIQEQKPCWLPVLPCFWNSTAPFATPAVGKAAVSSSTRSTCRLQKTVQVHIWKDAIQGRETSISCLNIMQGSCGEVSSTVTLTFSDSCTYKMATLKSKLPSAFAIRARRNFPSFSASLRELTRGIIILTSSELHLQVKLTASRRMD